MFCKHLSSPMCATCSDHLILLDFITVIISELARNKIVWLPWRMIKSVLFHTQFLQLWSMTLKTFNGKCQLHRQQLSIIHAHLTLWSLFIHVYVVLCVSMPGKGVHTFWRRHDYVLTNSNPNKAARVTGHTISLSSNTHDGVFKNTKNHSETLLDYYRL
jgi:hypothetical protein